MYKNEMTIAGFLGQPPVIRQVKNNMQVCSLSVAVMERRGLPPNQTNETIWYKVTVFGNDAVTATSMLTKGDNVMVIGKPTVSSYTNKQGEAVNELSLIANKIYRIEDVKYKPPKQVQATQPVAQPVAQPAPQPVAQPVYAPQPVAQPVYAPQPEMPTMPDIEDDLPF